MKEIARVRTQGPWIRELEAPVKRWRVQKKRKGKKWKKEEEEKETTSEAQKKSLVDKAQRTNCELPCVRTERRRFGEKGRERGTRVPERDNFWEDLKDGSSFS